MGFQERINHWQIVEHLSHGWVVATCMLCGRAHRRRYSGIRLGHSRSCLPCARASQRTVSKELAWVRTRYSNIKQRCCNPRHTSYHNYGGRGIRLEFSTPAEFVSYVSQLPGFHVDRELDRIDNDGHYARGNLRWASDEQQSGNTRKATRIMWGDSTYSLRAWTRNFTSLTYTQVRSRLHKGYTFMQLVTEFPR